MSAFWVVIIAVAVLCVRLLPGMLRRKALLEKYGSDEVVDRILAKQVWQGMTVEQLEDSQGRPEDVDETVLRTNIKQVWKYGGNGRNRYRRRVMIENGLVIGWQIQ